jgi:ADP-heptose:LPS heptosyltransferase
VQIADAHLLAAGIGLTDSGTYFHISPFTTADHRELPPAQLSALIALLARSFPDKKLVLSCAPTPRELDKMEKLMGLLPEKPWRVLAGNLNLIQLAAVIRHSALHFCGNTGALHLAVMTETPVVAWFWPNPGTKMWLPSSDRCQVLMGSNPPGRTFLDGIATEELVRLAKSALSAR